MGGLFWGEGGGGGGGFFVVFFLLFFFCLFVWVVFFGYFFQISVICTRQMLFYLCEHIAVICAGAQHFLQGCMRTSKNSYQPAHPCSLMIVFVGNAVDRQ